MTQALPQLNQPPNTGGIMRIACDRNTPSLDGKSQKMIYQSPCFNYKALYSFQH